MPSSNYNAARLNVVWSPPVTAILLFWYCCFGDASDFVLLFFCSFALFCFVLLFFLFFTKHTKALCYLLGGDPWYDTSIQTPHSRLQKEKWHYQCSVPVRWVGVCDGSSTIYGNEYNHGAAAAWPSYAQNVWEKLNSHDNMLYVCVPLTMTRWAGRHEHPATHSKYKFHESAKSMVLWIRSERYIDG